MSRVFIFEYYSGGGQADELLPDMLAEEGGAILTAIVSDFLEAGVEVLTTCDTRTELDLFAAKVRWVRPGEDMPTIFDEIAAQADQVLVIAPETEGQLLEWVQRVRRLGAGSLNAEPAAIELCGDKLALAEHLARAGVPTVPTHESMAGLKLPVVTKPRTGAGCQKTFLIRDRWQLDMVPAGGDRVYQPWVPGSAASASLIIHGKQIQPLLPGEQLVEEAGALIYCGGRLPLPGPLGERAMDLAIRAARAVPGLGGFVGVDLILGDLPEQDRVVEINPRVTASYVGLRKLCQMPLAKAMLDPRVRLTWSSQALRFDPEGRVVWMETI
ncbi:MAG: ATP-grasp domain-containing protein [Phycisphaeraceae bacterium]